MQGPLHPCTLCPSLLTLSVACRHLISMVRSPMYVKYNGVLRGVGRMQVESEREGHGQVSVGDIEKELKNMYTTTLHVINSCIVKLSKLTVAAKVYRGISAMVLPKQMKQKDEFSVRGGVEFGFMSCSRERKEALKYATSGRSTDNKSDRAILIEMQMGMIDRGADFSWLSQYPHEREVLFAPLTGIEIVGTSIDNEVLVVSVRPSSNLNSLTIEEVIAKMQRSHVQLVELLTSDLRFAGVPPDALNPLSMLKVEVENSDPSSFNSTNHYRDATNRAVECQREVFKLLSEDQSLSQAMGTTMLKRTAEIAAKAGEHSLAIGILKRAQQADSSSNAHMVEHKNTTTHGEYRKRLNELECPAGTSGEARNLFAVAKSLMMDGLQQPWPATLVALGSTKSEDGRPFSDLLQPLFEVLASRDDLFAEGCPILVFTKVRGGTERLLEGTINACNLNTESGNKKKTFDIKMRDGSIVPGVKEQSVVAQDHSCGIGAALRYAAQEGKADVVACLLRAKASVYHCDARGNRAMILAAQEGHDKVCRELVDHAPALKELADYRNRQRQSAHDLAVSKRALTVYRVLKPQESDEAIDREKFDAFVKKVQTAHDPEKEGFDWDVHFPPGQPVDVCKHSDAGFTLLMLACRAPKSEAATSLINHLLSQTGVEELNRESKNPRYTALSICAEEGRDDLMLLLLDKGADAKWKRDSDGTSPLTWAVAFGHLKCCELLIEAKADIDIVRYKKKQKKNKDGVKVDELDEKGNVKNGDGKTLLMLAAMYGGAEIAKLLLKKKESADGEEEMKKFLNKLNAFDESALTFCTRYGLTDVLEVLFDYGISIDHEIQKPYWTSLHRAAANGHESTVRLLLRKMDCEKREKLINHEGHKDTGVTPLHAAATSDYAGVVQLLIESGADATKANNDRTTPLHSAAMSGQLSALRVLLSDSRSNKALNGQTNTDQHTPLMAACAAAMEDSVRLLLKTSGIKTELTGADGDDALAIAVREGHDNLVKLLTAHKHPGNLEHALKIAEEKLEEKRNSEQTDKDGERAEKPKLTRGFSAGSMRRQDTPVGIAYLIVNLVQERIQRENKKRSPEKQKPASPRVKEESVHDDKINNLLMLGDDDPKCLGFKRLYSGQLVPPRPTKLELRDGKTKTGRLHTFNGIVTQRGPFNAIYMRVGCMKVDDWMLVWRSLMDSVQIHLEREREKDKMYWAMSASERKPKHMCAAIYVVVSQRVMQTIDFQWLASQGFRFYHHRSVALLGDRAEQFAPLSSDKPTEGPAKLPSGEQAGANDGDAKSQSSISGADDAEFIYYCWPGKGGTGGADDKVPGWSTSIEGVTGLLLSPDETKLLLVWERGGWNTPAGAVDPGECKINTLAREAKEELSVALDWTFGAYYLGGYHKARARENSVNDNFSVFVARLQSEDFKPDGVEIKRAGFVEWRPLLEQWKAQGRPKKLQIPAIDNPAVTEPMTGKILKYMENYVEDRGLPCKWSGEEQTGETTELSMELQIGNSQTNAHRLGS